MRRIMSLLFVLICTQIYAQIPKEIQGYWQFKVDRPGDWNGFEIGEDYIEGFYQIYKVKSVEKVDGKIRITLDAPNHVVYEFQENVGVQRKVKITARKDTFLCTRYDRDPDIENVMISESLFAKNNWVSTKNSKEKITFDKQTIQIGNEVWNVKWFGRYKLNNEYRALVEQNGIKRLLYLSSNINTIKLVYDMKPHFYSKEGLFLAVYDFLGNYFDTKTNQWKYGFFEEFALIDGVPAFYNSVDKTKEGYKITFFDNKKFKSLDIKLSDNAIAIGKNSYQKVDKFLPNYKGEDKQSFYDSKFQKVDTAYISGYIRNNDSKNPFSIGVLNWLTDKSENYYGDVDEYGFFTVKVPLYNTSQAFMDWRRGSFIDVLSPGEKYFVFKDLSTGETIFRGDNERFHNEIVKYSDYKSKNNISPKTSEAYQAKDNHERKLKDTVYLNLKLAQLDSLRKIDQVFVNQSNPSARAKYFINKQTEYGIASDLMQKKFQLNYQTNEKFSDQYMSIVKKNFFDNNIEPLSLVRDNDTFLRDYLSYQSRLLGKGNGTLYHDEIVVKLINKGDVKASADLKKYADLNLKLVLKTGTDQDSIDFYNLIKQDSNISKRYTTLVEQSKDLIDNAIAQEFQIIRPMKAYDNFVPNHIKDVFIGKNILSLLKNKPVPLSDNKLEEFTKPINNQYIRTLISVENEKLKKIALGKFRYADNLKNTDHLKEAKDADKIIAEILAPHKGKVVYMDFWGTWCGPCVDEMEFAPAAKKAMEAKDVVFIYMANRTPKSAWENFIKVKDLEGKNVYHYNLPDQQQSMVERRLEVPHFPTYMLFDKNGDLVNKQAPRPSNLKSLIKEVDKYLSK